jgi:hypothetical protein
MEAAFTDDRDRGVFDQHIEQLTYLMTMAESYGAVITVESEQPFARAQAIYDVNFMQMLVERGHGVGTHCDFGFNDPLMSVEAFASYFAANKALVDALVGAEHNLSCSGGAGVNDYVLAADRAGFDFLDGVVTMHYLSMPMENRPSPQWTDEYIRRGHFHEKPLEFPDALYPFALANAEDLTPDADGVITFMAGELPALDRMAEEYSGQGCRQPRCPITLEDVDAAVAYIREIDASRDPSRFAQTAIHLQPWSLSRENDAVLQAFFAAMQDLVEEGILLWEGQRDIYLAYVQFSQQQ